jgi:hypothetical protein
LFFFLWRLLWISAVHVCCSFVHRPSLASEQFNAPGCHLISESSCTGHKAVSWTAGALTSYSMYKLACRLTRSELIADVEVAECAIYAATRRFAPSGSLRARWNRGRQPQLPHSDRDHDITTELASSGASKCTRRA